LDQVEPIPPDEGVLDRRAVEAALARLPEGQREALTLRYFADLSYEDIANVLGIPVGTVMSRLHLGRKALASLMAPEER
jgi:RNA polymerase sigma-70 factor (ECF subfamily)